jgi:hypothetical protein
MERVSDLGSVSYRGQVMISFFSRSAFLVGVFMMTVLIGGCDNNDSLVKPDNPSQEIQFSMPSLEAGDELPGGEGVVIAFPHLKKVVRIDDYYISEAVRSVLPDDIRAKLLANDYVKITNRELVSSISILAGIDVIEISGEIWVGNEKPASLGCIKCCAVGYSCCCDKDKDNYFKEE